MTVILITTILILLALIVLQHLHYRRENRKIILEIDVTESDFDHVVVRAYFLSPATKKMLLNYSEREKQTIVSEAVRCSSKQFVRTIHYQIESIIINIPTP
jgi:hypothetical protein